MSAEGAFGHEAVADWLRRFAAAVAEHKAELVRLDTAIGDGDHGTNLDRGMRKVVEKLDGMDVTDIGATLKAVGMTLVSSVGGAAGPLYGTLFLQMGTSAGGRDSLDLEGWTAALDAGVQGVKMRGKAEPGDKTMLDALMPAVEALRRNWHRSAQWSPRPERVAALDAEYPEWERAVQLSIAWGDRG